MAKQRRSVKLQIGRQRFGKTPPYPSEVTYQQFMNDQAKELTDILLGILKEIEDVAPDIMMEALEPTFEKAKVYTPKDTMELVNSGYLEVTQFRGNPRVEMGFARGGKPYYATYVHEILEYEHKAPTQAKFLERAMMEDLDDIRDRLVRGFGSIVS